LQLQNIVKTKTMMDACYQFQLFLNFISVYHIKKAKIIVLA